MLLEALPYTFSFKSIFDAPRLSRAAGADYDETVERFTLGVMG